MARTPEGRFQDKVTRELETEFNAVVVKNTGRQGFPDLTAYMPLPITALLELKVKKPSPSKYEPNQQYYLHKLERMGFFARTVTPENWEQTKRDLHETIELRAALEKM